jgi:cytidylate kinase
VAEPNSASDTNLARPVIAIDGPSGAGKSTIARLVAARLGLEVLDTGAMYRAVALLALRDGLAPPLDEATASRVTEMARVHQIDVRSDRGTTRVAIDGADVTAEIRSAECSTMASAVSAIPGVRRALVPIQRDYGASHGAVVEGRDMGTVVFPDAPVKVFLTATEDERARRRHRDLTATGSTIGLEEVQRQQAARDLQDSSRTDSPLIVAEGAVVIDTTELSPDQVVDRIVALAEAAGGLSAGPRTDPYKEAGQSSPRALDSTGEDPVRSRNHGS